MGCKRMAQILARAGLALGTTTIRRMAREHGGPPDDEPQSKRRRRRVVARYPGHTWHVDLTTVPTRAGFWVPWFPFSLPQRWPFCWWVALAVDQVSRSIVGFAVFPKATLLRTGTALSRSGHSESWFAPKYVVTDKGKQFWCRSFKRWCKRQGIRPRYGRVGEPASIAIVERCIRSMKEECTRCLLVPMSLLDAAGASTVLFLVQHRSTALGAGRDNASGSVFGQIGKTQAIGATARLASSTPSLQGRW